MLTLWALGAFAVSPVHKVTEWENWLGLPGSSDTNGRFGGHIW